MKPARLCARRVRQPKPNGNVWLEGEREEFVIETIRMIEENSHTEGLTAKVEKMLERGVKNEKE